MQPTSPERGERASTIGFHELLVRHGPAYLKRFSPSLPGRQREVLERLLRCRTQALGGQLNCAPTDACAGKERQTTDY